MNAPHAHAGHDCCNVPQQHHGHHHGAPGASPTRLAASATLHCLSGCAIGEFIGLALGVALGLPPAAIALLATLMGFASGYALGLWPLVRQGQSWSAAFRAIWLGETISIAAMELAMNVTDYFVGGMQAGSLLAPRFWIGYALALPAGFIAAFPVNAWLLRRNIKQPCH